MIAVDDVSKEADRALAAIVAAAADLGVTLPSRHLTGSGGVPVFDCELVAVYVVGLTLGNTGSAEEVTSGYVPCPPIMSVSLTAHIVRCAREKMGGPRGNRAPEPTEIAQDLADASADIAVMHNAASGLAGYRVQNVGEIAASYGFMAVEGGMRAVTADWRYNLNWVVA